MVGLAGALIAFLISVPVLSQLPDLSTHKEVKAEIDVAAPAELVWRVLTDFPAYATWNPYIYRASGDAIPGRRITITLHAGTEIQYSPTVLVARPGKQLTWRGVLPLAGIERVLTWSIHPIDADRVRLVATERFQGLLLPLVSGVPADAAGGLDLMIKALRDRAELLAYGLEMARPLPVRLPSAPAASLLP